MNQPFIQELQQHVQWQYSEIIRLQKAIDRLSSEIEKLQSRPAVTVEKLEYKFDQLKVETLEGTLHIGLNPTDLAHLNELSIPHQPQPGMREPNQDDMRALEDRLTNYLREDGDALIQDSINQTGNSLEEPYINMIKTDIERQLAQRITHYYKLWGQAADEDGLLNDKIFKAVQGDIQKSIHQFISTYPHQLKHHS